ncbi:transcription initiation factor TFIID subunit 7-like [Teleopsis dalmanni]|uniref:transcription initiation factor TFIID subunit 7-like n=1 Tax=Teleopsis dalmanni TaxID=139649 RepID=UPI0018CFB4B8|nr:transcription initiation factor TFIID subunit 7-like [Teleopsis dalmanni]
MDDFLKILKEELEKLDLAAKKKLESNEWAPKTDPIEETFLLRLPEKDANEMSDIIDSGKEIELYLTIDDEDRNGTFSYGDKTLHARVVDLPTIVESEKIYEPYGLYKTANISQMVMCTEEEYVPKQGSKPDNYLFPHGLTPGLKNVRKHRFRKSAIQEHPKAFAREAELKKILLKDIEAFKVNYKIFLEEPNELSYKTSDDESSPKSENSNTPNMTDEEDLKFVKRKKDVPSAKVKLEAEIDKLQNAVRKLHREKILKSRAVISTDNNLLKRRLHDSLEHLLTAIPKKEHQLDLARKRLKRF